MEAQGKTSTPGQWDFSLANESPRQMLASLMRLQPAALIAVSSARDSLPKCQRGEELWSTALRWLAVHLKRSKC